MHYKFVGGPLDGEYHEADGCNYWNVAYPNPFEFRPVDPTEAIKDDRTICRYSLREFGQIKFYADSEWPDTYVFGQLVHHYQGRPTE